MNPDQLQDFAVRYTASWCSQDAASVAAFFAEDGWLTVNDGPVAMGRAAITESAQQFMTDFPDLVVEFDRLVEEEGELRWYWTMLGTFTGPGGTGRSIHISGYEALSLNSEGLIHSARGHYDEADYNQQLGIG